ncbi:MAG: hypothetical protein HXX17_12085 [Geobacteraceae bacterium]|nr:hypothetical protein [Geobacteraceae bacterium]
MTRQPSAGSIIEARCTRCREILNHTIVAMIGEKIARVECNTCKGTHNYRPVKPVKEPSAAKTVIRKTPAPRKVKVDPLEVARAEWEELQPNMNPDKAIPYDLNRAYRAKNLLLHPVFGLGVVQLVLQPNKIDVLFQEGVKRLRCG